MTKRTIRDSRAMVTGASSGIGRALAIALARAGASQIIIARREEALRSLSDEIARMGGPPCVVFAGDITAPGVRTAALDTARTEFGGLDILVNNAGVSAHGRFTSASADRLRHIMEVNFFAPVELLRAAVPLLSEGRNPVVVNVASILAHRGIPFNSEYCASKFALRGFSESVRPELLRLGIHVLVVSPGTTDTELFDHLLEKTESLPWEMPRGVPPENVARAVVRAVEGGKDEIIPHRPGRLLVWANRFCPRLVSRWLRRYG